MKATKASRSPQSRPGRGPRVTIPPVRAAGQKKVKRVVSKAVPPSPRITLCLTLGPRQIGLAIASPVPMGPLSIDEIDVTFPNLAFPLDVSGGVNRFRHRRGELRRLRLSLTWDTLAAFVAPKLRDVIVPGAPRLRFTRVRETTVLVEVAEAPETRRTSEEPLALAWTRAKSVLAFEVTLGLEDDQVILVVGEARGASLAGPATRLAMEAVARIVGSVFTVDGATFHLKNATRAISSTLFPEAGARAPRVPAMGAPGIALDDRGLEISFREGRGFVGDASFVRAREGARLTRDADLCLQAGDLEGARHALVDALTLAPRHPDVARRLVEIDARTDGRTEAALTLLRDAEHTTSLRLGDLAATLLSRTGDRASASARAVRDAEREPSPTLRALVRAQAAALTDDPLASLRDLEEAQIDAQAYGFAHFSAIHRALEAGRFEVAESHLGGLEALASAADQKCAVLIAAGAVYVALGHGARAKNAFERALLYAPDDARALTGLGEALVAAGNASRGASLLLRATEIATTDEELGRASLALARCLLDDLGDAAAAVARARQVPSALPESPHARLFEARARLAAGDHDGARIAFARLRDEPLDETHVSLLVEAATLERDALADRAAALRTTRRARALAPLAHAVLTLERSLLPQEPPPSASAPATESFEPAHVEAPAPPAPASAPADDAGEDLGSVDPADLEARVEQRLAELRADPTRDEVVDDLVALLTHLDRGLELLALLSARLEDAPPERRDSLLPHQRSVLARLETSAREAGREQEASLFAMSREMLG